MKLHLPKTLLAAVMTCVSSWATGAYATTLTDATMSIASFTQENLDTLTNAGWTLTGFTGNIQDGVFTSTATAATIAPGTSGSSLTTAAGTNNSRHIWSAIVTVKVDSLTDNVVELLDDDRQNTNANIGLGASSSSVTGTWVNNLTYFSLPSTYNNGDGTVTFGIVYEGENGTTLYVGSEKANNNGLRAGQSSPNITLTSTAGIEYTNLYWFNNAVSSTDMQSMLSTFDTHRELTWSGTANNSTWDANSVNWNNGTTDVSFGTYSAPNVIFSDAVDASKTVNVSGEQNVSAMTLQDSYTFDLQEGARVTADSIHINVAGKTLSLTGNGTVHTTALTLNSSSAISMASNTRLEVGGSLTLSSSSAISMASDTSLEVGGNLTLSSSSAISMASNSSLGVGGNITLANGTANALGNVVMRGNMTLVANGNSTLSVQGFSVSTEAGNNQALTLQGAGTLTISGGSELKNVYLQGADLVVNANTTMATLGTQNGSINSEITVKTGVKLTTSNINNNWGIRTMTVNGELNTGAFLISTGADVNTICGTGVINADSLEVTNVTTKAAFSGVTLNLGSSGIIRTGNKSTQPIEFGDMTVGVKEGADGWSTTLNTIKLAGTGTGTKFAPGGNKSITISGNMSGSGKLVKTEAGTLTLSGTNTYTGGTTVEGGTLIVNSTGALGTGTVTVTTGTDTSGTVTSGNLELNAAGTSTADLVVNGGSATLNENGSWAGAINVGSAGTLAFNGANKEIAANKSITFADGATLAVTGGSLTIRKGLSVTKLALSGGGAVTVAENLTLTGTSDLAYDKVILNAGKSITTGENGKLISDGITYANGAVLTRGENSGNLSAWAGGFGVTGGNITIKAGADNNDRNISMAINGGNVVSNVVGMLTLTQAATMDSFVGGSGGTTFNQGATFNGASTFNGESTITGDAKFGGLTTLNGDLTVTGSTTLATADSSIVIGEGKFFSTDGGVLTVTGTADSTRITTSAANAEVSTSNEAITISNAAVTVNSATDYTLGAKLSGSTLTNSGTGAATVKVEEDTTNNFDASTGNVTVNTGSSTETTVGDLNVGTGQSAEFTTNDHSKADVVVSHTANVSGTVSANVTVQKTDADAATATFTANAGAEVNGNLTVTGTGKLAIANDNALTVSGVMTLEANSELDVTALNITQQTEDQTFVIANAASFTIDSAISVLGLDAGLSWNLTNNAGNVLLSSSNSVGTNPATPAMFAMRNATDSLTLTVFGPSLDPDTLTATATATGTSYADDMHMLTIGVAGSLNGVTGDFNVSVGSDAWQAIVNAMSGVEGGVNNDAFITLTDANGFTLNLKDHDGTVAINGYTGTGTKGEYHIASIPEPTTATLSLLALAALAARRRRK